MKQRSAPDAYESDVISRLGSAITHLCEARTSEDALSALLRNVTRCTLADEAILLLPDTEGNLSVLMGNMGCLSQKSGPFPVSETGLLDELLSEGGGASPALLTGSEELPRLLGTGTAVLAAASLRLGASTAVLLAAWKAPRAVPANAWQVLKALAEMTSAVLANVQARCDLERLVEERTRSLQAVNDELQTFAYIVSHDLKNPLTIIKTCVWTLQQRPREEFDERSGKAIDRIAATVERMRDQIDGMLQMYRLTKDDVVPEHLDLSAMALEILEELRSTEKNRRVKFHVAPDLNVRGDPTMLMVMMENLLGNAWKYSSKTADAFIEVGSMNDLEGAAVFFVRDNGAGFNMNEAGRLFHVFQRLHPEDEFSGSGIGLASVQRIVNRHGGRVWAESEKGKGAAFYFKFPEEIPAAVATGSDAIGAFAMGHRSSAGRPDQDPMIDKQP